MATRLLTAGAAEHTSGVREDTGRAPLKTDPRPVPKSILADAEPPGWTDNLASAAQSNMILGISVASAAIVIVIVFAVVWYVPRKR